MKIPGLRRRKRKVGEALYWVAADVSRKSEGYPTPTIRIHSAEPDDIAALCARYSAELLEWVSNKDLLPSGRIDGTIAGLITHYRRSDHSPYHDLKQNTRRMYDESLNLLERNAGAERLANLTGADFRRWYKSLRLPRPTTDKDAEPGPERVRRAFKAMQLLRIAVKFGVTEDVPECTRLSTILAAMRFASPAPRTTFVTFEQSEAIIRKAMELGRPSIALAQALQFDLTLRQIDIIGEWEKAPGGKTGIVDRGQRWSGGILWSEIGADGILRKRTTKTGQEAVHDTRIYPRVADCLDLVPLDRRVGPIIVNETTGLPYRYRNFYQMWRAIATKAGVPKDVWNRDSRAGGVTEATDAGVDLETMRHHANHANPATTAIYSRNTLQKTRSAANQRLAERNRPQS